MSNDQMRRWMMLCETVRFMLPPEIAQHVEFHGEFDPATRIAHIFNIGSSQKGYGRKAVAAFERWAKDQGAWKITGQSVPQSLPFWWKLGYRDNRYSIFKVLHETALTEAGKVVYSNPTDDGKRFVIIRDPTVQQFNTMLTNARYRLLRMLCKDQHIYCWDGYYADHDIGAHVLGFSGGPSTIGVRLEATSEFVNYGHRIDVDLRGTEYGPRNYSAVRDAARQAATSELEKMLNEYPQLNNLVGNLPTSIECKATFDNDMEFYRDMMIGPLNSFR